MSVVGWRMAMQVLIGRYDRVAIVGGPRTGKSTLANAVRDRPVIPTDSYMDLPWEDVPAKVIEAAGAAGGRFVVEGVQAARALRKGLEVDAVIVMTQPKTALTSGQAAMGKGVMTVFEEWRGNNPGALVMKEPV
jgi:predicted GTPase